MLIPPKEAQAQKPRKRSDGGPLNLSTLVPSCLRGSSLCVSLFALLAFFAVHPLSVVTAEEPFFKKDDVIALVGGEDMVAASEYGYLELLLTRALPDYQLKFRSLAWEGDTVFEQRRDLNFPPLEAAARQDRRHRGHRAVRANGEPRGQGETPGVHRGI